MKRQPLIVVSVLGLAALAALFAAPSCAPDQLQWADRVVSDVNAVGTAVRIGTSSPAVPSPVRTAGELIGGLTALALLGWREIRASKILEKKQDVSQTLTAVVDAIDQAEQARAGPIKDKIQEVMQGREIFSKANAIVDEHRSKLAT